MRKTLLLTAVIILAAGLMFAWAGKETAVDSPNSLSNVSAPKAKIVPVKTEADLARDAQIQAEVKTQIAEMEPRKAERAKIHRVAGEFPTASSPSKTELKTKPAPLKVKVNGNGIASLREVPQEAKQTDEVRLAEIKADGVISADEQAEIEEISQRLSRKPDGDFPVILIDLNEGEINHPCENATPMNVGDRIFCAEINFGVDPQDTTDYFVFTLDDTYDIVIESHLTAVDECQNPSMIDSYLHLYADDCVTELAYDDDGGEVLMSRIATTLDAGEYFIKMRAYSPTSTAGSYHLTLNVTAEAPPNDLCENAQVVGAQGYPETGPGSTINATHGCYGDVDWIEVWYEIILPYDYNDIVITVCPTEEDQGDGGLNLVANCNDCSGMIGANSYTWPKTDCVEGYDGYDMTFLNVPGGARTVIYWPAYIVGTDFVSGINYNYTVNITRTVGACCDDATTICTDDVAEANCQAPLRWAAHTLCDDLMPPCGGCDEDVITIDIFTDSYPGETSWEVVDHVTQEVIASGAPTVPSALNTWDVCIGYTDCYDFIIYDSWGDGINAPGYYEVLLNDVQVCYNNSFYGYQDRCEYIGGGCGTLTGACCVDDECVATNLVSECDVLGGDWYAGEDCFGDPPFECPEDPCEFAIYNNGGPAGNAMASQCSPAVFAAGVADDFELGGTDPVNLTEVVAWIGHWNATPAATPADYDGVNVTIYGHDAVNGMPGGEPIDADPDCNHLDNMPPDGILYTVFIPQGSFSYTDESAEFGADCWMLQLPVSVTVQPNTKYWLEVQPVLAFSAYGQSGWRATDMQTGAFAMQIFEAVVPPVYPWTALEVDMAFCLNADVQPEYCESYGMDQTYDWITNVTIGGINNTTGAEIGGYGDYTALSTDVNQGSSHTLSVTFVSSGASDYIMAWVDWNQNWVFDVPAEQYDLGTGVDATVTVNINVPMGATLGQTRMRVSQEWGLAPGPCTINSYGDVEDYTINVLEFACDIECVGTDEGEPDCYENYVDIINGGCNSDPPVFGSISCDETVCGTSGTYPFGEVTYRDTDWFQFEVTVEKTFTVTCEAEFPVLFGIIVPGYDDEEPPYDDPCDVASVTYYGLADPCVETSVSAVLTQGNFGYYWVYVAPQSGVDVVCGSEYAVTLDSSDAPIGACCVDYVCVADNTPGQCAALGGSWFEGELCSEQFVCPEPPYNDVCSDAIPQILTPGGTLVFTGTVENSTDECPPYTDIPHVWEAFTIEECQTDVNITLCGTDHTHGSVMIVLETDCNEECISDVIFADTDGWADCGDGFQNIDMTFYVLGPGTYYYRILNDPMYGAVGNYVMTLTSSADPCNLPIIGVVPDEITDGQAYVDETDVRTLTVSNSDDDMTLDFTIGISLDSRGMTAGRERPTAINIFDSVKQPSNRSPNVPGLILQGGDLISTATPIASFPYNNTGTTAGYNDDYEVVGEFTCYTVPALSPDVVYSYVCTAAQLVNVDLSGSSFDTKLYIFQDDENTVVACDDDYWGGPEWWSAVFGVIFVPGHTYYIVVEGFDATYYGDYVIDITSQDTWLYTDVVGGSVPAGGNTPVEVTMDALGLTPATYTGNVIFTSNDLNNTPLPVPVTFTVETAGYQYLAGDVNMALGIWPPTVIGGDVTYLVGYFIGGGQASCMLDGFWCSADINGDCTIIGGDVTALVGYFVAGGSLVPCPQYPSVWPPVPGEAPDGWPNCDMPVINVKIIPTGSVK